MFQDISIDELRELQRKKEIILIDVRSPSEYKDATIPGSLNIPLFDDDERAVVGTLYTQVNVQAAKDKGLEIVSAKLPAFIKQFEQIEGPKMVFCWRGGMRSKTTATVLSLMGIRAYRLSGGVRAYRRWVVETLEHFDFQLKSYVINGNTGSGKTLILRSLKAKGFPVLDFEEMAGHRGSAFGGIGMESNNQKTFESLLLKGLQELNDSPIVLFEAESKRIGKAVLPEFVVEAKEAAVQLFIEIPIEERVKHILEDYRPWEHKEACLKAFRQIKSRIHTPIAKEIEAYLQADDYAEAVKLLLEHYYDPRYEHSGKHIDDNSITFKVRTIEEAVELISDYLITLNIK
ncbi:tRNA 2-selenouridine synthase [compost metagenome]